MTSDARERLRAAKQAYGDFRGSHDYKSCIAQLAELMAAVDALLAEPPAPAPADYDALDYIEDWANRQIKHGGHVWGQSMPGLIALVRELRARPRAVPDAGALLRELRAVLGTMKNAAETERRLRASSGYLTQYWEGRIDAAQEAVECCDRYIGDARAPQPQPQREGCTCDGCGVEFLDDVNIDDVAWAGIHPRAPGGLLCGACIVRRLAGVPAGLNGAPQPAPEEPSPTVEKEWLDAHGEHRREQAQASEATDYETLPLYELRRRAEECDALRKERDASRKAYDGLVEVSTNIEEHYHALRKENEELRAKLEAIKKAL